MAILADRLRKYLDKDFCVEHTDAKPFFISGITPGIVNGLDLGDYKFIQCYFKCGEIDWITLAEDHKVKFNKIFNIHLKNQNFWRDKLRKYLILKKKLDKDFDILAKKNLSKLS
ncbi:MAG: hypothetical protein PHT54_04310, partial [Candidatus Nanoarchaeia archaeon]|nr:hypothetical protein [Candidatus Nanoarchaeia archaeon]